MRIAVFGAGGVGGYFGGRLAASGKTVLFIARGEHLKSILQEGLRVESVHGNFIVHPAQATDDVSAAGQFDAILVAVKAWQVPEAAKQLKPMIGDHTVVVPLQNGVEAVGQLIAELGRKPVIGGLCRIISFVEGPGKIRHAGAQPYVAFNELDGKQTERVENLRRAFERAGVHVEVPDDIQKAIWEKFLFIASVSGVGAVTRSTIGVIRSVPETRHLLEQAMEEICRVAEARGISLGPHAVEHTMQYVESLPKDGTASMQRDILQGLPSELEAQNGAVYRLGKEVGVETPVHQFIYASLLPLEMRARKTLPE